MINITGSTITAFKAEDREIGVRCTFNDNYVVDGEYVKDLDITEIGSSDGTLSLGNVCSNQLSLNMYVPDNFTGIANAKIKVEIGIKKNGSFDNGWTDAGVFYVDTYKTNTENKSVSITAYDAMQKIAKLGSSYTCGRTETKPYVTNVIKDILSQAGISDAYIGNSGGSATTITAAKDLSLIHYNDDGTVVTTDDSVGYSTNLVSIPASDKINVDLSLDYDINSFKLVFFTDANGNNFHSFVEITDIEYDYDFDAGTTTSYVSNYSIPPTAQTLYMAICSDLPYGVHLTQPPTVPYNISITRQKINFVNPSASIENPHTVNISPRTMLGYMCAILGTNCMIDKHGHFVVRMLKPTTSKVELTTQYQNGFETDSDTILTPTYLTTGYDNEDGTGIITVGSGTFGFNFENPYITTLQATNIINAYKYTSFKTGRLDYRYNPAIELNDIVYVEDKQGNMIPFLNQQQAIKLYGGLKATISCTIDRDATPNYVSAPLTKTVTQINSDIGILYQDIISALSGNNGGYVKFVYDSQDKMRAIAIPTRDIDVKWDETAGKVVVVNSADANTAMWVWSEGGLAHTPNGGTTYNAAMTNTGGIVAERIVGTLGAFVRLQAEVGTIGGWNITENELYSDVTINGTTYRAFIQNANAAGANSWVFSVQKKVGSNPDSYTGEFIVMADGRVYCNNNIYGLRYIYDMSGYQIFGTSNDIYVFGLGAFVNSMPTYLEGYDIILRNQKDGKVYFQRQSSNYLTADYDIHDIIASDNNTYRTCLMSSGGFLISAGDGRYALILEGKSIFLSTNDGLNIGAIGINASGKIVSVSSSSERYKKYITENLSEDLAPEKLYDLPVKQFEIKKEYEDRFIKTGKQIGLIAEDVDKYYPNACVYGQDNEIEGWNERIIVPAMLKLIQEQKKEIDNLNDRLTKLENLVNKLTEE